MYPERWRGTRIDRARLGQYACMRVFAAISLLAALSVSGLTPCVCLHCLRCLRCLQGKVRARGPEEVEAENPSSASLSLTWPFSATFFKVFQAAADEPENLWGCMSVDEDADHSGRSGSQRSIQSQ